jgi:pyroglutamyl-peptidase
VARVLFTAFGPFGSFLTNPSEVALKSISGRHNVATHCFRTSYQEVARDLPLLLRKYSPEVVVAFGLASNANAVRLERVAKNTSKNSVVDVDGQVHKGSVVEGGPEALHSTLPIEQLLSMFTSQNIHAESSSDAGGYVCNFLFYLLQSLAVEFKIAKSGLVHLPDPDQYRQAFGVEINLSNIMRMVADEVAPR